MKSFSDEYEALVQSGEVSERDKPFIAAFKEVYESVLRVEEMTSEIETNCYNADVLKNDAKKRLGELRYSLDRLQTSAIKNPVLQPFADKVVKRAREISQKLEEFAQENFTAGLDDLYNSFKHLKNSE